MTSPSDTSRHGFLNFCMWTLWDFGQEKKDFSGIIAWVSVLAAGAAHMRTAHSAVYSFWSSHISKYEVCHFLQYFLYLKYSNCRALKLSSSCTLELKRFALEKLSNCSWINAIQGLRIARNTSGMRGWETWQSFRMQGVGWLGSIILSKW